MSDEGETVPARFGRAQFGQAFGPKYAPDGDAAGFIEAWHPTLGQIANQIRGGTLDPDIREWLANLIDPNVTQPRKLVLHRPNGPPAGKDAERDALIRNEIRRMIRGGWKVEDAARDVGARFGLGRAMAMRVWQERREAPPKRIYGSQKTKPTAKIKIRLR